MNVYIQLIVSLKQKKEIKPNKTYVILKVKMFYGEFLVL